MTVSPDVQQCIRRMDADGAGPTEMAGALGVCRNSVYKYSRMEDLSPQPPVAEGRKRPAIDRYAGFIVGMLVDDRSVPRKQRHSAQKIFDRLVAEQGYAGSYPTVCRFVREWKLAREQSPRDGFLELDWAPGAMQADYGAFTATVAGERLELKLLVATFPHSNARFCIAMTCEKAECFCEGLAEIFEMAGRAPRLVVLDNATEAGRMLFGRVTESKLFSQLRAHYRFEARFCNPDSGNEKGSAENAVGFLRRNLLVPVPSVPSLDALNSMLLSGCRRINAAAESRLHGPAPKAFAEDLAAMMALPGVRFDSVRWVHVRSDKRGYIQLGGVSCCAGPAWRSRDLLAGAGARTVEIMDMHGRHAASLPRSWRQGELVRNPASLVPAPVARPGAFGESVIRRDMPEALLSHMDRLEKDDLRRAPRAMGRASDASGFDAACQAAERLFAEGRVPDDASCDALARRIASGGAEGAGVDLAAYDRLAGKGGSDGKRR
ncbi:IS21 family transposase [Collinsella stercoris DSM 13279]|uniref:IS21 family transposase n=1 Tax=Collinsella stercoris TaxID=147206 RepID=UPI001D13DF36|nr:IS21 family transposase [Collinsella stercoris]UEA44719.1 IS21 family transposase [Collinsella stercoris DSM 13279]